jgi:cytochrome b6-f complex iron-sulfur subunit
MEDSPSRSTGESDASEEARELMSRRRFLDHALTGTLVATAGVTGLIAFSYLRAPESSARTAAVDIGPIGDMPPGTGKVESVGATSVIVVRPGDEEAVVAFAAACTHLGCIVAWKPELKQIVCPCHGATFDLNGNVVSGPAPRPLPAFPVSVQAGNVILGSA